MTNTSSLAHWQQLASQLVNTTRQMGLLHSFTSFISRHPFESSGNDSLALLEACLGELGLTPEDSWFPVMRRMWNGVGYTLQPYWTRNLYVSPWGIVVNQPSLIVTCHVDSARYTLLGLTPTFAPGANDDAAGVVVLLEALQVLTELADLYENWNVLFAFLNGEEGNNTRHLWGSNQLVTHDLITLGIDSSEAIVLNVDEVGYKGQAQPTHLALYRYQEEDTTSLTSKLEESRALHDIPLEDMGKPRVDSIADVDNKSAWSTSEWTFHASGIPSITLSTNQYPDPVKHTPNDVAGNCEPRNLCDASTLVVSTILALTYQVPPSPHDRAEEWSPLLANVISTIVVDYIDFNESAYTALILDPALNLDETLTATLTQYNLPILALGESGARLLEILADIETTTTGTQTHFIDGFLSLHPAIASSHLLVGSAATPFLTYPVVHAVAQTEKLLSLVGNETWCSMGYYADSKTSIVFIGIDTPLNDAAQSMATASLAWLLDGSEEGILLGVGLTPPRVGDHTTIYVLMCDYLTMTGSANELVHVNVTSSLYGSETTQLVTNESGVATL
ncbi:MAG: M28 family peptidase, partial [Promethearchaeota archaeon]